MTPYVEIVNGKVRQPRIDPHPVISIVRPATENELLTAKASFDSGRCDHTTFTDESHYMYDVRVCAICKHHIALI